MYDVNQYSDSVGVTITLSSCESIALFDYMESGECPNYWESPLAPVHARLKDWYRCGGGLNPCDCADGASIHGEPFIVEGTTGSEVACRESGGVTVRAGLGAPAR